MTTVSFIGRARCRPETVIGMQKLDYASPRPTRRRPLFPPGATVAPYAFVLAILGLCAISISARGPRDDGILLLIASTPFVGLFFSIGGLCLEPESQFTCRLSLILNLIAIVFMTIMPALARA